MTNVPSHHSATPPPPHPPPPFSCSRSSSSTSFLLPMVVSHHRTLRPQEQNRQVPNGSAKETPCRHSRPEQQDLLISLIPLLCCFKSATVVNIGNVCVSVLSDICYALSVTGQSINQSNNQHSLLPLIHHLIFLLLLFIYLLLISTFLSLHLLSSLCFCQQCRKSFYLFIAIFFQTKPPEIVLVILQQDLLQTVPLSCCCIVVPSYRRMQFSPKFLINKASRHPDDHKDQAILQPSPSFVEQKIWVWFKLMLKLVFNRMIN